MAVAILFLSVRKLINKFETSLFLTSTQQSEYNEDLLKLAEEALHAATHANYTAAHS